MKTFAHWSIALAVLATLTFNSSHDALAKDRFAVIDLRRAVADTEDGLRVQAKLQRLFDSRQSEYESKEQAYKKARAELEALAKSGKAKQSVLRKKYAALEKQALELQQSSVTYRREMQKQEQEAMYPIVKQMLVLVRQLSQKEGFDMVLNKESVPYFRSDLDLTDRVVQMYNARSQKAEDKGGKKKSKAKRPAPRKSKPKTKR